MNTKHIVKLLVVMLVFATASGCVAGRKDLGRSGEVNVITDGSGSTEIPTPSVYEEKGELVVSGQVRRSMIAGGIIFGHIHIQQLSSDGSVIREANKTLGMITRRGRMRVATYTARLPWLLTPGSTIRVSLSGDKHAEE